MFLKKTVLFLKKTVLLLPRKQVVRYRDASGGRDTNDTNSKRLRFPTQCLNSLKLK